MQARNLPVNRKSPAQSSDSSSAEQSMAIAVVPQAEANFLLLNKKAVLVKSRAIGLLVLPLVAYGLFWLLSAIPAASHFIGLSIKLIRTIVEGNWWLFRFFDISTFQLFYFQFLMCLPSLLNQMMRLPPTHLMILPEGLIAFRANQQTVDAPSFQTYNLAGAGDSARHRS